MDITEEIIQAFRAKYPYFADAISWPDEQLTIALCEGDTETGGAGWGGYEGSCSNFKQRGMFLFAAHWLVAMYPLTAINPGKINGSQISTIQSKSVGDESVSYAVSAADNGGDSWMQSTQYGQQFMRLRKRAGMGACAV